jgi:hypothetical protein
MVWMHLSKPPGVKITKRRPVSLETLRQLCRYPRGTVTLIPPERRTPYLRLGCDKSRRALRNAPLHCGGGALVGCNLELPTDSTIAYAPFVSVLESRTAIRSPAVPSYQGPMPVPFSRWENQSPRSSLSVISNSWALPTFRGRQFQCCYSKRFPGQ